MKLARQVQQAVGENVFFARAINFTTSLSLIDQHLNTTSFQLEKNQRQFVELLVKYIELIAREAVMEKEIIALSINSFFVVVKGFKSCDQISQGLVYNVETKLTEMID